MKVQNPVPPPVDKRKESKHPQVYAIDITADLQTGKPQVDAHSVPFPQWPLPISCKGTVPIPMKLPGFLLTVSAMWIIENLDVSRPSSGFAQ